MVNRSTFGSLYFSIFGLIVLAFGLIELVVIITNGWEGITWGVLEISGMWLWWRGIILVSAGLIYLSALTNFLDIRQLAKSVTASIMIWIVAGMEILARVTSSIPGGEGTWVNSPNDFVATYAPPYMPEIYLLPLSLLVLLFIRHKQKTR